ncbi:TPA: hypothetical protein PJH86_002892 [Raoultella ornithinolytica]|nr:hypothetical protein [Raoultella ornithinolytica]
MGHNFIRFRGDCYFDDDSVLKFDIFTITDNGYIVVNLSGNCEYGPYKGEVRINLHDGIYHGEGLVTYSGVSVYSFSLSLAINITESFCSIYDGVWRENGEEYYFSGDLDRIAVD